MSLNAVLGVGVLIGLVTGVGSGNPDNVTDWRIRQQLPSSLARLIEVPRPETSHIEWTLSSFDRFNEGLVERHITRTVGDTLWQSNLGDDGGQHRVEYRFEPPKNTDVEDLDPYIFPSDVGAGTRASLIFGDRVWSMGNEASPSSGSRAYPRDQAQADLPFDFWAAGLAVAASFDKNVLGLPEMLVEGFDFATFTSSRQGAYEVIAADYNDRRIEWLLDVRQDGVPVQAYFYDGGNLTFWSETSYAKIDGRLFPTDLRFYDGENAQPYRTIEIQRATFDKPWHMQEITPADIGAIYGTHFTTPMGEYYWSGTDLITNDEYWELVHVFGIRPDNAIIESLARSAKLTVEEFLQFWDAKEAWARERYFNEHGTRPWLENIVLLKKKPGEKDEWDVYVEQFVAEHKLEGEPVKQAEEILDRAKKMRDARLRKNAVEIRKAQREGNSKKLAHYERITKRIFEEVLVRTLNRLLPKSAKRTDAAKTPEKQ